ncbi:MAG TPA: cation diffusion facilitator family transporter [Candidatus Dormibacteraeota bacterium]
MTHAHYELDRNRETSSPADQRRVGGALCLLVAFMAAEVAAGLVSHSLALLSDAGHMLTDAGALGLSLLAMQLAATAPRGGLTYGLKRAEILSALANGIALFVIAALILFEAARRLATPIAVDARWMLGVALAGVVVNGLATALLARSERQSLNLRGSLVHLVTDLYSLAATVAAAIVILVTGFTRVDAAASLLISLLMIRAAYGLVRDATRVLLEAAPEGTQVDAIGALLAGHGQVVDVHDFHVWEITSGLPALSAHVLVEPGADCHAIRRELEAEVRESFGIDHTTLQVDHATPPPGLIQIEKAK